VVQIDVGPIPHVSPLRVAAERERDLTRSVVLIGFKEQGNLGLGYLAATLEMHGYHVVVVDFEDPMEAILSVIDRVDPILVGLSLIFQFYVHRFEALARYLREHGVSAHFTMGGHFPSLSPEETLALVPQLDSVVRFEGELTLLELVDRLGLGLDWRATDGLAHRKGGQVVETPARRLLPDLDELPYPHRTVDTRRILGRTCSQLVASRGCARTCSFCSIHMFYRTAPGKVVRTRRPAEVAREMRMLYEDLGATVLLFQDDDFPIFGPTWHRWCSELLDEIERQDLVGRVLWKINCRADAVDPSLLADMRDAGLYLVYLGLESGSDVGLRTLNKGITVEQNVRAVEILKDLAIRFDFGFMMLDPSSTFESVLENVAFLRTIVGDGSSPAEFCRMVPYDGTPIKEELARAGRLRGDVLNPDYDFLDPRLEVFFRDVNEALNVTGWIHGLEALSPQLKFAWSELAIMERLMPELPGLSTYHSTLQSITRDSNAVLFETVEQLVEDCRDRRPSSISRSELGSRSRTFVDLLVRQRNAFVLSNQPALLRALDEEPRSAVSA
jgi:anaerobic magnesium-protoporphyrin IX monomethyl ester cyclase